MKMNKSRHAGWLVLAMLVLSAGTAMGQELDRKWVIQLGGFFRDGTKPVYLYAHERGGEWGAVVGSSRDPDRQGGKTYNRSWYYGDLSGVPIKDGKMKGQLTLHMTPDLWVPRDHKLYSIVFDIDASVRGDSKLEGKYKVVAINTRDESVKDLGKGGAVTGTAESYTLPKPPEPVTFRCNMQSALVGGDPNYGGRCMGLWLVKWPVGLKQKNPADVLPLCYRDSTCGFYVWRNRWQDAGDTVITVLANRTQGYTSSRGAKFCTRYQKLRLPVRPVSGRLVQLPDGNVAKDGSIQFLENRASRQPRL